MIEYSSFPKKASGESREHNQERISFMAQHCVFSQEELKKAYTEVLDTNLTSTGKLLTGTLRAPIALVAESMDLMRYYLCQSIRRQQFVPICLGEPGTPEEIQRSLEQYGVWVGVNIPNRDSIRTHVKEVKENCKPTQFSRLYL